MNLKVRVYQPQVHLNHNGEWRTFWNFFFFFTYTAESVEHFECRWKWCRCVFSGRYEAGERSSWRLTGKGNKCPSSSEPLQLTDSYANEGHANETSAIMASLCTVRRGIWTQLHDWATLNQSSKAHFRAPPPMLLLLLQLLALLLLLPILLHYNNTQFNTPFASSHSQQLIRIQFVPGLRMYTILVHGSLKP